MYSKDSHKKDCSKFEDSDNQSINTLTIQYLHKLIELSKVELDKEPFSEHYRNKGKIQSIDLVAKRNCQSMVLKKLKILTTN